MAHRDHQGRFNDKIKRAISDESSFVEDLGEVESGGKVEGIEEVADIDVEEISVSPVVGPSAFFVVNGEGTITSQAVVAVDHGLLVGFKTFRAEDNFSADGEAGFSCDKRFS